MWIFLSKAHRLIVLALINSYLLNETIESNCISLFVLISTNITYLSLLDKVIFCLVNLEIKGFDFNLFILESVPIILSKDAWCVIKLLISALAL